MTTVSAHGLSPFLNLFFRPRATIRAIVDLDPRLHVLALALIAGGLSTIPGALVASVSGPAQQAGPFAVALTTVFGAIAGVIGLYIGGWLLTFTGWQLGGVATPLLVRAALAWSNIPSIVGSAIMIVALVSGGVEIPEIDLDDPLQALQASALWNPFVLIFAIWSFVVSLKCLGEVHGFSALRALVAYFLVAVEVGIVAAVVALIVVGTLGLGS
jgi:MFS family permease